MIKLNAQINNEKWLNPDYFELPFGLKKEECEQMVVASKVMIFESKGQYLQSKELIKDCEKKLHISEYGIIETESKQIIVLFENMLSETVLNET